jgi:hypothetical protein
VIDPYGGSGAPSGNSYTKIYSTNNAFAALKVDGSIKAWGGPDSGGENTPTDKGYIKIYSTATQLNKSWYSHYQRAHLCLHYSNHPTP